MAPNPSDIIPSKPPYDAAAHYKRVLALYEQYPIKDEEAAERHAAGIVVNAFKAAGRKAAEDFAVTLVAIVETTFKQDKLYWHEPPPLWSLDETEKFLSRERLETATECMTGLLAFFLRDFCPEEAFSFSGDPDDPGTPLIELVADPATLVHAFSTDVINAAVKDQPVFASTGKQLLENFSIANGVPPGAPSKPGKVFKFAGDFALPPTKLVESFLRNTAFEVLFTLPLQPKQPEMPILTDDIKFEHTWCLAAAGAGKTTLILNEIVANLRRDNPPAMVVLDPKGTITPQLSRLAVFAGKHRDRLIIVDPTDVTAPPAINMFHPGNAKRFRMYAEGQRRQVENQAITLFSYVFASRGNALTPQQATCFNYLVRLLFSIDGANIHTILDIINDQLFEKQASIDKSPWKPFIERQQPIAQRWFRDQYYNHLVETRKGIATRLYGLLEKPELEAAFSARERKLDMFDALQTGKTVIVNLPKALLGQEGMELFGRYIIALTLASAFERITIPDRTQWHPAFLYIDEFQEFADETKSAELLQLAREFRLGVLVAHQDITSQLTESLRSALATNTTTKYVSSLGGLDANFMAREMNCDADFFQRAVKTSTHARFASYVRGLTPQPVIFEVPFRAVENEPQMTAEQYAQLLERNRAYITEPREDRTLGIASLPASKPREADPPKAADPEATATSSPHDKDPGEPSDEW